MSTGLDAELLKILVCPLTKLPMEEVDGWLVCSEADPQRRYPIRDGVPVLLIDEAEILSDGEWKKS